MAHCVHLPSSKWMFRCDAIERYHLIPNKTLSNELQSPLPEELLCAFERDGRVGALIGSASQPAHVYVDVGPINPMAAQMRSSGLIVSAPSRLPIPRKSFPSTSIVHILVAEALAMRFPEVYAPNGSALGTGALPLIEVSWFVI
jgi:hypothetical protein